MARRRFFVDQVLDGKAELRGEEAQHLGRVLRAEAGQVYEVSDGRAVYLAEIQEATKLVVKFQILEQFPPQPPLPDLTLYLALIKFDSFEWAIEKATELGASSIVPVECARSEAGLLAASVKRSDRWRKLAREASQQCRRVAVPVISPARKITKLSAEPLACRLEETPGCAALSHLLARRQPGQSVNLLVGPEGGWTDSERALLDASGWQRASLGNLVLRAETAATAALAIAGQSFLPAC